VGLAGADTGTSPPTPNHTQPNPPAPPANECCGMKFGF